MTPKTCKPKTMAQHNKKRKIIHLLVFLWNSLNFLCYFEQNKSGKVFGSKQKIDGITRGLWVCVC